MELDTIDLTDLDRFAHGFPHEVFAALRREAPVWWHEPTRHTPDGEGFWVVSRHEDVRAVAAAPDVYSSATGPGRSGGGTLLEDMPNGFVAGSLFNMMDDPRHQRIRRLLTPALSPRRLRELEADLRGRAEAIVDAIAPRGACDFLTDVAAELPLQAVSSLMGVPQGDRHRLFGWANAFLDYDDRDLGESSPKLTEARVELFTYGGELLRARAADPGDDILSILATATIEGDDGEPEPIPELEQQLFFNLLVGAGGETTRNAIAGGLLALLDAPEQLAALRADRSLLGVACEEILRWTTPDPYNRRTAVADTTLRDREIGAGEKVTIWWASANRDPSAFDDPDTFDIRRDPNPHLAFGLGTHFCLGAALARVELRVVLDVVLDRLDDIALAGEPEWVRSNKHTGLRHMPISFAPRGTSG